MHTVNDTMYFKLHQNETNKVSVFYLTSLKNELKQVDFTLDNNVFFKLSLVYSKLNQSLGDLIRKYKSDIVPKPRSPSINYSNFNNPYDSNYPNYNHYDPYHYNRQP